jgi:hypothetical protein
MLLLPHSLDLSGLIPRTIAETSPVAASFRFANLPPIFPLPF